MKKIYRKETREEDLFIVGKLHRIGNWRKFEAVQKYDRGFHYILVEQNTHKWLESGGKFLYQGRYGWVVYNIPDPIYNYDYNIKNHVVTHKKISKAQLEIYKENIGC